MKRSEKISFEGASGAQLAARLDRPQGETRAVALFAHCFTCSKESAAASRISGALAERGIATLRFDFTGLGGSDGEFANETFSSNVEDLVAAARFLEEHESAPQLLVGHSLGGTATLVAARRLPSVRAVATIGSPFDPAHVTRLFQSSEADIERDGEAEVSIGERRFRIRKEFLEDIREHPMRARLAQLDAALLVMHSPTDDIVDVDNARLIFEAARHPKSFVALDGADHLLSRRPYGRWAAELIATWASRYLDDEPDEAQERSSLPPGTVVVTEAPQGRFTQEVSVGSHRFLADEPTDVGGLDLGPNPYDLLLAALGTCTAMTLRLYAERKKLALERVRVSLTHEKVHAQDCADCETQDEKVDRIERVLELAGELTDDERRRLLAIADRCPVHRTLHSEIQVATRLGQS